MHPRSGLAARHGLSIVNTPGTIDAGYRGEIKVLLVNHDPREPIELRRGDRIAQLVVQRFERAGFVEVEELPDSVRGAGGYGSTGGFGPSVSRPTDRPDRGVSREVPPQGPTSPTSTEAVDRRRRRRRPARPRSPGPSTSTSVPDDGVERVDLGSLLIAPASRHASCGSRSTSTPARCSP